MRRKTIKMFCIPDLFSSGSRSCTKLLKLQIVLLLQRNFRPAWIAHFEWLFESVYSTCRKLGKQYSSQNTLFNKIRPVSHKSNGGLIRDGFKNNLPKKYATPSCGISKGLGSRPDFLDEQIAQNFPKYEKGRFAALSLAVLVGKSAEWLSMEKCNWLPFTSIHYVYSYIQGRKEDLDWLV